VLGVAFCTHVKNDLDAIGFDVVQCCDQALTDKSRELVGAKVWPMGKIQQPFVNKSQHPLYLFAVHS
jgi:hypothetical protein